MDFERVATLAEKHGASLVLFARQWTRDPDDAFQEALVDLLRLAEPPMDPAAWLFTTVKRKAMNHIRSETRRKNHTQSFADNRVSWFAEQPSDRLMAQEVRDALEQLPDSDREILVAKVWGDLSFQQVAELVNRSRSAVHRRYQAALRELLNHLESPIRSKE